MTATLTIERATITGITFVDAIFAYDGVAHSVGISGDLPLGVTVSYSDNDKTSVGNYLITASFLSTNDNYNPLEDLTASLMIYDDVNSITNNGIIYQFNLASKAYIVIGFTPDIFC